MSYYYKYLKYKNKYYNLIGGVNIEDVDITHSDNKIIFKQKKEQKKIGEINYEIISDKHKNNIMELKLIFIEKEFRHRGYAKLFLIYFITNTCSINPKISYIKLENLIDSEQFLSLEERKKLTLEDITKMRDLYHSVGFEYIDPEHPYYKNDMIYYCNKDKIEDKFEYKIKDKIEDNTNIITPYFNKFKTSKKYIINY